MPILPKIIEVDTEKCVNCHSCITVCPVKFSNDAGNGKYVTVNNDLCIGCGQCIKACTHNARIYLDDFQNAMESLKKKEKIIAIAAPAVASNFPNQYLQFNGWLKSLGVSAIFDVSFGAELTIKTYLEHIQTNNPKMVISQPCPAIVTYIQIYMPQMIPYLAPADSPMMHTMKMIKRFYPQYANHKILIVSPCIAKKREFQEVGIGDYNVTLKSLKKHITESHIDLSRFPKTDYDNPPAERAVLFSSPGGLMMTALRENPDIIHLSRKIEGPEIIYKYINTLEKDIEKGYAPLLVDCLNCEMGCNGGTGTDSAEKNHDELEFLIAQRSKEAIKNYSTQTLPDIHKTINQYWEKNLYKRTYKNLSENYLNQVKIPSQSQIDEINKKMLKFEKSDSLNCHSCGYLTCEKFAVSIYNGLNKMDNCYAYLKKRMKNEYDYLTLNVDQMLTKMKQLSSDNMNEGQLAIKSMLERIQNIVNVVNQTRDTITELEKRSLQINDIIKVINKITKQTNLLSINASIEATRAGMTGKGFTVVAKEIKKLAEETNKSISVIENTILQIQNSSKDAASFIQKSSHEVQEGEEMVSKVNLVLNKIMDETNKVVQMIANVIENVKTETK